MADDKGRDQERYWAIDVPGLTQAQAEWLVSTIGSSPYKLHAIAADPRHWYTARFGRDTAEVVVAALRELAGGDIAQGLSEDIEAWLEFVDDPESGPAGP